MPELFYCCEPKMKTRMEPVYVAAASPHKEFAEAVGLDEQRGVPTSSAGVTVTNM